MTSLETARSCFVPLSAPPLSSSKIVTAVEHIRSMRGGSQPHLMRCSDGRFYVVKFPNNPQGRRILVNEYLAGKLAQLLELPIQNMCLVDVRQEFVLGTPELSFYLPRSRSQIEAGLAFGSEYPSRGIGTRRALQSVLELRTKSAATQIENISDLYGILIFDKWTSNMDNRQILCVARSSKVPSRLRMFMIDNGFCFGSRDWSLTDLPAHGLYLDRSIYSTIRGFQTLEPWMNRLEANVTLDKLTEIAEEVPSSWVKDDRDDLLRLVKCLYERKRRVLDLVRLSLKFAGGSNCARRAVGAN